MWAAVSRSATSAGGIGLEEFHTVLDAQVASRTAQCVHERTVAHQGVAHVHASSHEFRDGFQGQYRALAINEGPDPHQTDRGVAGKCRGGFRVLHDAGHHMRGARPGETGHFPAQCIGHASDGMGQPQGVPQPG